MYVLTMQCGFMKWAEVYAVLNQGAKTCAGVLTKNGKCRYGAQDSDQGRNFESQVFKKMCHLLEINKMWPTAYHAEGNG